MEDRFIYIYGKHAIREALTMRPDVVTELFLHEGARSELAETLQVKATVFKGDAVPRGVDKHAVHQGYIAKIDTHKLVEDFDEFVAGLAVSKDISLALLGELHDPHNVGAVIRSAAGFGLSGVLIPEHRQVGVTGTVVKVSAGMAFAIPLVRVPNVNRAIEILKEKGFFVYGLAGEGDTALHTESFTKASVFVFGNEGEGMREKTKEHCDIILSIKNHPQCESLNASATAAVVFYAWSVQHQDALR